MKRFFMVIGCLIIAILVSIGVYCKVNDYHFRYSVFSYSNGTTLTNYFHTQTKDNIQLKAGSFKGSKNYQISVGEYEILQINGDIEATSFSLELYNQKNQLIKSLTVSDFPYETKLTDIDTKKIKFVINGDFSGDLSLTLE